MTAQPMTAEEAADYAPQWGSYMTAGDPGAVIYCDVRDPDAKRPMADHVRDVLLPMCRRRMAEGDSDMEEDEDSKLESLLAYLVESGDLA